MKIDGSDIDAILDLAGAPKKKNPKTAADLEKTLGITLATETKKFLERPVELHHPDAVDSSVKDSSFLGKLPDVGAWIEQLGKNREGLRQCVHHFLGLYPIGQQLQYGDMMVAMIVLEPFTKQLSGVMYYDEREVGTWGGGSISGFLMEAMAKYVEEDGERDCFVFDAMNKKKELPPAAKMPPAITKAWTPHWRWRLERHSRWWIMWFLSDQDPRRMLSSLPTEKEWKAEKAGVAKTHHEGMYWLLAHWLLGNERELEEAALLAKKNPSKLVAALSAFVQKNEPSAKQKKQLDRVLEAVRLAAR
jgi:hypothetical protein